MKVKIQHGRQTVRSLFVAAASPLHGGRTLRTVPLPLRSLGQTHAAVVEPLDGTLTTTINTDHQYIYLCSGAKSVTILKSDLFLTTVDFMIQHHTK